MVLLQWAIWRPKPSPHPPLGGLGWDQTWAIQCFSTPSGGVGADLKSATGRLGESTTHDGDLSTQPMTASFMDPAPDTHTVCYSPRHR